MTRLYSLRRLAVTTVQLAMLGVATGAIAAVLGVLMLHALLRAPLSYAWELPYAAQVGGFLGLFLAPVVGYLGLRHVVLWRAIVGTAAGALLGGIVGAFASFRESWAVGAVTGVVMAIVWLRQRTSTSLGEAAGARAECNAEPTASSTVRAVSSVPSMLDPIVSEE